MMWANQRERLILAFGGGLNSVAELIEMHRRRIRVDLVLFADTGGERPETYATVRQMSDWNVAHGLPEIIIVREERVTLEDDCLKRKALPSIAYGFKSCSDKWKLRPQKRFVKTWLQPGEKYFQAIGYDADEERRMRTNDDKNCTNVYPLIEWGIYREDCERIAREAGITAGKSSCFFCPSMKKHEILKLKTTHPELYARAVEMEANAETTTIKGLGRDWSWTDFVKSDEQQGKLFNDNAPPEEPCGCYDG